MGFQFNHVGGGTKTRRPITLHMKYNSACVQPNCFLLTEDAGEQEVTLEELQARPVAPPQITVPASQQDYLRQQYPLAGWLHSLTSGGHSWRLERWLRSRCVRVTSEEL